MTPTQTALLERLRATQASVYATPYATYTWAPGVAVERVSVATVRSLERLGALRLEGGRLPVACLRITEGG